MLAKVRTNEVKLWRCNGDFIAWYGKVQVNFGKSYPK